MQQSIIVLGAYGFSEGTSPLCAFCCVSAIPAALNPDLMILRPSTDRMG